MLLSLKNASTEAVKSTHFYISTFRDILCEEMRNARKALLYTKVQRVCLEKALVKLFELPAQQAIFFQWATFLFKRTTNRKTMMIYT